MDTIQCMGRANRGQVSVVVSQLESGTCAESHLDGCRVCRICWVSLEKNDVDVVTPCRCKGSMEYVHVDCLKAWQDQLCRMKGKNPLFCDVCHQAYTVNPGARLLHHRVRRLFMSMAHSHMVPLIATMFRTAQHYIVSLSLMSGLETAMTSMASSVSSWRTGAASQHGANILRTITGISIMNIVVARTFDGVLSVFSTPFKALKRLCAGLFSSWPRRLVFLGVVRQILSPSHRIET